MLDSSRRVLIRRIASHPARLYAKAKAEQPKDLISRQDRELDMFKIALAALVSTMLCGTAQAATYLFTAGTTTGSITTSDTPSMDAGYYLLHNVTFATLMDSSSGVTFINFSGNKFTAGAAFNPMTGQFLNHYIGNTYPDAGTFLTNNGPNTVSIQSFVTGDNILGNYFDSATGYSRDIMTSGPLSVIVPVVPPVMGAVPEPATWLTMILGMGAIGFAMRRQRKVSTTVKFA